MVMFTLALSLGGEGQRVRGMTGGHRRALENRELAIQDLRLQIENPRPRIQNRQAEIENRKFTVAD